MAGDFKKISSFKNAGELAAYLKEENINIGLVPELPPPGDLALARPLSYKGRTIGNRWAILPMEGWDCNPDGSPGELTRRRWFNFAASGAKLIYGTEAAAVMHSGKSNPAQLMAIPETEKSLRELCDGMHKVHKAKYGRDDDLAIGLQLTHSGRYSHPDEPHILKPRTAYAHPLLDRKFGCSAADVVSDEEVQDIIKHFVQAAVVAQNAGFDFVDIKHAHGYFAHELLSAVDRPGRYGGSFENRTRFFREVAEGIRKAAPGLDISVRLSLFDIMPFEKGEDGRGRPMAWDREIYPYAFGGDGYGVDMDPDLQEPAAFIKLMQEYGVGMICATIGSPYYNVHMQRPAYYPVSDGYKIPENPLYNVSRHLKAVRRIRELCPDILVVGSGYTCLQEFLPNAAEYAVSNRETDFAGIGRMVLSYPDICDDILNGRALDRCRICRTFGDCTNAPRAGMVSGCYPLDRHYRMMPEAELLKKLKKEQNK